MKPFDIELAKQGHKVQTKDGTPARIICYDRNDDSFPIVALIYDDELPRLYRANGVSDGCHDNDLVMAPTKKEGWVNIYPSKPLETLRRQVSEIYSSKEEALKYKVTGCIATIKIEWEE